MSSCCRRTTADAGADVRAARATQRAARSPHRGPPGAAQQGAPDDRRLVLRRPLRPGGHQRPPGMRVPPHPHTGLQTVSWLLDGEIHHRDSLGSDAMVVPGQLNLMTSGPGIAHSEESPPGHSPIMHGVQLWVALPDPARHEAPRDFTQYADLPRLERAGLAATVIVGQLEGRRVSGARRTRRWSAPSSRSSGVVARAAAARTSSTACWRSTTAWSWKAQRLAVSEIGYVGAGRDSLEPRPPTGATGSGVAARRRAVRRGAGDVVELHRPLHEEIVEFRERWNDEDDPVRARRGV